MSRLLISRTSEEFCDDDSISRERKTREFWRHTHKKISYKKKKCAKKKKEKKKKNRSAAAINRSSPRHGGNDDDK